jgi:hypothetical protein
MAGGAPPHETQPNLHSVAGHFKQRRTDLLDQIENQTVSLPTIGNGAAVELFEHELEKVLENIADVNTEPESTREITLKFKFKPSAERNFGAVAITVTSKMAGTRGHAAQLSFGKRGGKAIAVEHNIDQMQMRWDEDSKPVAIHGGRDSDS